MVATPTQVYTTDSPYELVLFDLRDPEARARLRREHAAWGVNATVEMLGEHHVALTVRPGAAGRLGR
jgi:hypothetical protein